MWPGMLAEVKLVMMACVAVASAVLKAGWTRPLIALAYFNSQFLCVFCVCVCVWTIDWYKHDILVICFVDTKYAIILMYVYYIFSYYCDKPI